MIYPNNKELESAVLGAMLLSSNTIDIVTEILKPDDFYVDANKDVYEAILSLYGRGSRVDILTVTNHMREKNTLEGAGGAYQITQLTNTVGTTAHIEEHALILKQASIKREGIGLGDRLINDGQDNTIDALEYLEGINKTVTEMTMEVQKKKAVSLDVAIIEGRKIRKAGKVRGVTSGINDIDKITRGWQKTDLIILAARPAMGKTAFALTMALNAGEAVDIYSLEQSTLQMTQRLISQKTGVPLGHIMGNDLRPDELERVEGAEMELASLPIYIDDTPALSITDLSARARLAKRQRDTKLIIVDYIQLMAGKTNKNSNREQEISSISRGLKVIAKELDVPIIALSQLSRGVEARADKRPLLSDLRESGAIEQDADLVAFLYRPEYYKIKEFEDGDSTEGMGEVIISKHRNGGCKSILCEFVAQNVLWKNLETKF